MANPTVLTTNQVKQQPFSRIPVRDVPSAASAVNDCYYKLAVVANVSNQHTASISELQATVAAILAKYPIT